MLQNVDFHEVVFDAMPMPIFIIDNEMCVIDFNHAAATMSEGFVLAALRPRTGDAIQCAVAESGTCGEMPDCHHCAVRQSVSSALAGDGAHRREARVAMRRKGEIVDASYLVTTKAFEDGTEKLAVLILEDITELAQLKSASRAEAEPVARTMFA